MTLGTPRAGGAPPPRGRPACRLALTAAVSFAGLALGAPHAAADTTIEAESMRVQSGKVARERSVSAGRAVRLRGRGRLSKRLVTPALAQIVVFARREPCRGRPRPVRMKVTVDGRRVLARTVSATNYLRYTARVALPAGTHTIALSFSTARRARACDRRLRLDRLVLVEQAGGSGAGTVAGTPVSLTAPPPSGPRGPVQFLGDFETGSLSQWTAVQRAAPDRIRVVGSPVRRGRYAGRFEVQEGDRANEATAAERAEVLWGGSSNPTLRDGQEHYIGWSTYFPSAEYPISGGNHMFLQTHPQGPLVPPIEMRSREGQISLYLSGGESAAGQTPWSTPLVRDQWHDFVLHARWSADPSVGLLELWHNGVKVVANLRVATLERPGADSYLKLGYYRPGTAVTPAGAVYHDEMRVGASYEAVSPAG